MFWRWECSFTVNAQRRFVYDLRERFVSAVSSGLHACPRERPLMLIRAWPDVAPPLGQASVLLFREQQPGETEEQARDCIDHGVCDLMVLLEALAQDRTFVTVRCEAESLVPGAKALLCEFARLYPEAGDAIESALKDKASILDPCNVIPQGWRREAAILWRQGYSAPEIGEKLGYDAKTVANRLSELRQVYGEEIVPTDAQRRQRLKK